MGISFVGEIDTILNGEYSSDDHPDLDQLNALNQTAAILYGWHRFLEIVMAKIKITIDIFSLFCITSMLVTIYFALFQMNCPCRKMPLPIFLAFLDFFPTAFGLIWIILRYAPLLYVVQEKFPTLARFSAPQVMLFLSIFTIVASFLVFHAARMHAAHMHLAHMN